MAARSRRPWLSVALGLVLGFTAASWLIAPKVAEMSERKRRASSLCSYYGRAAGGARAQEAAVMLGGTGFRSSSWELQPPAEEGTVPSPPAAGGGEGEPEEEEEAGEKRSGRHGSSHNGSGDWGGPAGCAKPRNFLYVGVMTAQKYLGSRAVAAQRTWARFIPGRVEFFSSQGSTAPLAGPGLPPLPVVALPGVDDSYPPQKKSFMMIKYMHDHYLDKYEWFMRADDDVYIKGEKLEEFLRSLNSSKPLYLGQTGLGNIEELGKLGLEPGENFCMGGPGMIFSREVLRRMVPHIGECLREMYTTHEDVEVGRCVRRFGGTQCVWSYEYSFRYNRLDLSCEMLLEVADIQGSIGFKQATHCSGPVPASGSMLSQRSAFQYLVAGSGPLSLSNYMLCHLLILISVFHWATCTDLLKLILVFLRAILLFTP